MAPEPSSRTRAEYQARINRVLDHIEAHLAEELTLDDLARKAGFSRHHFHRIFSGMVGETLGQFIRRIRLEKAAGMLLADPDAPVTNVCLDCGLCEKHCVRKTLIPARGRKQPCDKCSCVDLPCPKDPNPRKGTETRCWLRRGGGCRGVRKTLIPARGRKLGK